MHRLFLLLIGVCKAFIIELLCSHSYLLNIRQKGLYLSDQNNFYEP